MTQFSLFGAPSMAASTGRLSDTSPVPRFPRARRSDARSSHEAAALVERTGVAANQARQVLAAVRLWPNSTSMELADVAGLDRYAIARRLPELAAEGFVQRVEPTDATVPCRVSRKKVCRWRPT